MDFSLFKKIINEAARYNMRVALTGQGEPLLHPNFIKMLRYASERCFTRILTNASLLDNKMATEILEIEPDTIEMSFDGPTKEIYEHIRRRSNYDKTRRNIVNFLELKAKSGKKKPECSISIIRQPATEGKIEEFKEWCLSLPAVEFVRVNDLINWFGESELCASGEITFDYVKDYLPRKKWPICETVWLDPKVSWDGIITGCMFDYNHGFIVGDVNNESILEIWNGEALKEFRDALRTKQYERVEQNVPLCSKCNVLWQPKFSRYECSNVSRAGLYLAYWFSLLLNKFRGL